MKTEHGGTTTHPSLATLHLLFDGHAVDAATARHARDCPHCAQQLQALVDQRTALGRLLHGDADWVTAAQRRGRAVLADLLAELARACLARREAASRATPRSAPRATPLSELPRPIESITVDIRTLVRRLTGLAQTTARSAAPPRRAAANWSDLERLVERREQDSQLLAHCVKALRSLEGESPRWRALAGSAA